MLSLKEGLPNQLYGTLVLPWYECPSWVGEAGVRSEALRGVAPGKVCFKLLGNSKAEMRQARQQSRLGDN